MKVCVTNGLQPVLGQSGIEGIWTPQLLPEIGYCEYNCTLCGHVCPTGALPRLSLTKKHRTRLGLASIDKNLCIPWAQGESCLVCQEHCPVFEKAIKVTVEKKGGGALLKPYVDPALCVGCGICQNKCPVRPKRAITVSAINADRT
jgi:Pyruvate/2-oxoacid:ferredoxin oxidoreductase delta subunit